MDEGMEICATSQDGGSGVSGKQDNMVTAWLQKVPILRVSRHDGRRSSASYSALSREPPDSLLTSPTVTICFPDGALFPKED